MLCLFVCSDSVRRISILRTQFPRQISHLSGISRLLTPATFLCRLDAAQVTVAVDEAKNEHEILQTFAEGADAPLE